MNGHPIGGYGRIRNKILELKNLHFGTCTIGKNYIIQNPQRYLLREGLCYGQKVMGLPHNFFIVPLWHRLLEMTILKISFIWNALIKALVVSKVRRFSTKGRDICRRAKNDGRNMGGVSQKWNYEISLTKPKSCTYVSI